MIIVEVVLICARTFFPGMHIEENVVIATGSVMTNYVPLYAVLIWVSARVLKWGITSGDSN